MFLNGIYILLLHINYVLFQSIEIFKQGNMPSYLHFSYTSHRVIYLDADEVHSALLGHDPGQQGFPGARRSI